MIVKNESKVITNLLQSVKGLIDYWVIVDTGSTDNTKEIIQTFFQGADIPGELHDRPWVNFGHNRTEGLALAKSKGDYCLCVDADMIVINKGFDKSTLTHDVYSVVQETATLQYRNSRLLKTSKVWKAVGVTHEYYDCGECSVANLDTLFINDVGNGGCKSDKFERDIRLLRKGLIDEPNNVRYMFYLAQSFKDIGENKKAIKWYKRRIAAGGWDEEIWYSAYQIFLCKIRMKRPFEEVLAACIDAYHRRPLRIEPIVELLAYCRENGYDRRIAYTLGVAVKDYYLPNDQLFIQKDCYDWRFNDEFSIICYYVGDRYLGLKASSKLIAENKFPQQHRERILNNYKFYFDNIRPRIKHPIYDKKPKFLAIARAGDDSKHETWLSDRSRKNFDLLVAYYGKEPNKWRGNADFYDQTAGLKYPWFSDWLKNPTIDIDGYDAVWLSDDDIESTSAAVSDMFEIFHEHQLWVAQPAMRRDSVHTFPMFLTLPGYKLRYCNFVEAQTPIFSKFTLKTLTWTFGENQSGWGLDFLWVKELGHPKEKMAIIDAAPVYHGRPLRTSDMYTKVLPEKGTTAQHDFDVLYEKHGLEYVYDWHWGFPLKDNEKDKERKARQI